MNYFAHGRAYTHNPYFLAGTAVPDWLSIIDRQVRAKPKGARPLADDPDPRVASVARGILQHHADDDWFHQTTAFYELNVAFTGQIRQILSGDDGFRPAFLGHILVELLLDDVLVQQEPQRLDEYYVALEQVDAELTEAVVNRIAAKPTDRLALLLPRFIRERFLYDYADDGKLLHRLNQVMRRVNLPPLPERLLEFFPQARKTVQSRHLELLGQ